MVSNQGPFRFRHLVRTDVFSRLVSRVALLAVLNADTTNGYGASQTSLSYLGERRMSLLGKKIGLNQAVFLQFLD